MMAKMAITKKRGKSLELAKVGIGLVLGFWIGLSESFESFPVLAQSTSEQVPPSNLTPQKNDDNQLRKILVPQDRLNRLLDQVTDRIMISQQEYQKLLKSAEQSKESQPPVPGGLLAASYQIDIQSGVAEIEAKLEFETLFNGLNEIELPLEQVAVRQASYLDGGQESDPPSFDQPPLIYRRSDGIAVLLVKEAVKGQLRLTMQVPVKTTAARQSLSLRVPLPASSSVRLSVPGNVDLQSGGSVIQRSYDDASDLTTFDLLLTDGRIDLQLSLNDRRETDQQIVTVHSVIAHRLTPERQEIAMSSSLSPLFGSIDRVEMEIPDRFEINQLESESIAQWEIAPAETADGMRRLSIRLHQPMREPLLMKIVATKAEPAGEFWTVPQIKPLGVAGHASVVGLLVDSQLQVNELNETGLIPIDHSALLMSMPVGMAAFGDNPAYVGGAWYSPQSDYQLEGQVAAMTAELIVKSNSRLKLDDQQLTLHGGLEIRSLYDSRFGFKMSLPPSFRISEFTNAMGNSVRFDRLDSEGSVDYWVYLESRIDAKRPVRLYYVAQATPSGWLEDWSNQTVPFPAIRIEGQTSHSGSIAIQAKPEWSLRPTASEDLALLDESEKKRMGYPADEVLLSYRFDRPEFQLSLELERLNSIITSRSYSVYKINTDQLRMNAEVVFDVRQAPVDRVEIELPLSTPKSVSFTSDIGLKDSSSQDTESSRVWTVQLENRHQGMFSIFLEYRYPFEITEKIDLQFVPIRTGKAALQTGWISVEGDSELDVAIQSNGRTVDIDELTEPSFSPGRFALGTFSGKAEDLLVDVSVSRRPVFPLPSAIVTRGELVTSISVGGKSQTAARFLLATRQQSFIRIELPIEATLWALQLNGRPAKAQKQNDQLLISLDGETGEIDHDADSLFDFDGVSSHQHDLQIVYEIPSTPLTSGSNQFDKINRCVAPKLWLVKSSNSEQQQPALAESPIPLIDLRWRLILPEGYSIGSNHSDFERADSEQCTIVDRFLDWFVKFGGGIGGQGILGRYLKFEKQQTSRIAANLGLTGDVQPELHSFENANIALEDKSKSAPGMVRKGKFGEPEKRLIDQIEGLTQAFKADDSFAPDANLDLEFSQSSIDSIDQMWALKGLRSLQIQLTETGNAYSFFNLGETSELSLQVVHRSYLERIAFGISMIMLAVGIMITRLTAGIKFFYVALLLIGLGVIHTLFYKSPLVGSVVDAGILVILFLILFYLVVGIFFFVGKGFSLMGNAFKRTTTASMLFLLLFGGLNADAARGQLTVDGQLGNLRLCSTSEASTDDKTVLAKDAVIVPYRLEGDQVLPLDQQWLVPLEHYLRLQKMIDRSSQSSRLLNRLLSLGFIVASADYQLDLSLEQDLMISGKILLEVLVDDPVAIPLPFSGTGIVSATIDSTLAEGTTTSGRTANLLTIDHKESPSTTNKPPSKVETLRIQGRGRHVLNVVLQVTPNRSGGWREINLQLPLALAQQVEMVTVEEKLEVRLQNNADQRTVELASDQPATTILDPQGRLRFQWKPVIESISGQQSLIANSIAELDIREDGLRLKWSVQLSFRGSEKDSFSLKIPADFLVENVTGDNVRGWDVSPEASATTAQQKLDVALLGTAKDRESFTIWMSLRDYRIDRESVSLNAPYVEIESAALHQGKYSIRRSPLLELKTGKLQSARRIDGSDSQTDTTSSQRPSDRTPLGLVSYQQFQFSTSPFEIEVIAQRLPSDWQAELFSVMRVGASLASLESKIDIRQIRQPLHEISILLPLGTALRSLRSGMGERITTQTTDQGERIRLSFPRGIDRDFSVYLNVDLTEYHGQSSWQLPRIVVPNATHQQNQIVIQSDPSMAIRLSDLQRCETVLLSQFDRWLAPEQRRLARHALVAEGNDYQAVLNFSMIQPQVTVETVTNVRTTDFGIEETILLDFDIQQAGIREIVFQLPGTMKNARVNAKLLREKIAESVDHEANADEGIPNEDQDAASQGKNLNGKNESDPIRITLKLQEEIMGSYRVVIEQDRPIEGANYQVPLPKVQTGKTEQVYVTLQNSGRDEIKVIDGTHFSPLNRQSAQFSRLKEKLAGGDLTLAYIASRGQPKLQLDYELINREAFEMTSASIEFAKTTMIVDTSGAYRAAQLFQVNNRNEQYLEIELPDGALLLTVSVGDQPIRPVAWPATQNLNRLRIPLIKTPPGDLDFPVQLKYSGKLGALENWTPIEFPLIQSLNVNVQLSQLHLRLPESFRWLYFDSTMTQVDSRGELEAGYLGYRQRQIQSLTQKLGSLTDLSSDSSRSSSLASKQRAIQNLEKLEREMQGYEASQSRFAVAGKIDSDSGQKRKQFADNSQVQQLILGNSTAIRDGKAKLVEALRQAPSQNRDNRMEFNRQLDDQVNPLSRNLVNRMKGNFSQIDEADVPTPHANVQGQLADGMAFDEQWFRSNNLTGKAPIDFQDDQFILLNGLQLARPSRIDPYDDSTDAHGREQADGQQGVQPSSGRGGRRERSSQQTADSGDKIISGEEVLGFQIAADSASQSQILEDWSGQVDRRRAMTNESNSLGTRFGAPTNATDRDADELANQQRFGRIRRGFFGDERDGGGRQDSGDVSGAVGMEGMGGIGMGGLAGMGESETAELASEQSQLNRTTSDKASLSAGHLTSLQIDLPERGLDFYFSSPRGNAIVTARPLQNRVYSSFVSGIGILGFLIVGGSLIAVGRRMERSAFTRFCITILLFLAAFVSLTSLTLPLYGGLAFAAAMALTVSWIGERFSRER